MNMLRVSKQVMEKYRNHLMGEKIKIEIQEVHYWCSVSPEV